MPYLLAIETGIGAATVALLRDGDVRLARATDAHANAAETLPLIEGLLAEAGIGYEQLAAIACGIGPGSFTGIRIGLAAARGIAFAAQVPFIGVNTLEATAFAASLQHAMDGTVLVALDAMRGQLYTQSFRTTPGALPTPLEEAMLRGPDECREWLASYPTASITGNAHEILANWQGAPLTQPFLPALADAETIGQLGLRLHQTGTPTARNPLYVRAPDAKLPSKPSAFDQAVNNVAHE